MSASDFSEVITENRARINETIQTVDNAAQNLDAIIVENREAINDFTGVTLFEFSGLITDTQRLVNTWNRVGEDLAGAREMEKDPDPEIRAMGAEEAEGLADRQATLEARLKRHLIPRDPRDEANIYLEIRAGTGGDEAALFAGDLFRMYSRYAEKLGWQLEVLSAHDGEHGGYKVNNNEFTIQ